MDTLLDVYIKNGGSPSLKLKDYITEEGTVLKKGVRWSMLIPFIFMAASGDDKFDRQYYWAKILLLNVKEPLIVRTKYNFQKGTRVRVKYDKNNPYNDCEIVVDWE